MKHILVVDDDMMNLVLVKHALSGIYKLTCVTSGQEAIAALEEKIPDLVLLDIEMPEMNGREVAAIMKDNPKWKDISIVYLTANADPDTEADCFKTGADDFIIKPFVPVVVQRRISRLLELKDLRQRLELQLEQKEKQIKDVTRISVTDALTGLFNRSYMEKKIAELLAEGRNGMLFIMDMDNFKQVNDTFGHIAGDKALQIFADAIKKNTRRMDVIGRLGGDEFVVFFADMTDKEIAAEKARAITNSFLEKFRAAHCMDNVSVSIGIASAPEDGTDFTTLYKRADKALYHIKNNGKSSFHFFDEKKELISPVDNTDVDINNVRDLIEGKMDTSKGAFQVAYDEFQKIYDFVSRCVTRKQQKVQTVLLTLHVMDKQDVSTEEVEHAMVMLQEAVKDSLRAVDVGTGYSSRQYMLILMDADMENGTMVVERVVSKFYDLYGRNGIELTYDIQTMHPELK